MDENDEINTIPNAVYKRYRWDTASIPQRRAVADHLGWAEGHEQGPADLEWLHPNELRDLVSIPLDTFIKLLRSDETGE